MTLQVEREHDTKLVRIAFGLDASFDAQLELISPWNRFPNFYFAPNV